MKKTKLQTIREQYIALLRRQKNPTEEIKSLHKDLVTITGPYYEFEKCQKIRNHCDNDLTVKDIVVEEWVGGAGTDGKGTGDTNYMFIAVKGKRRYDMYEDSSKLFPSKETDHFGNDSYQRASEFIPPAFSEEAENCYLYTGKEPINTYLARYGYKPYIPNVNPETQHVVKGVPRRR